VGEPVDLALTERSYAEVIGNLLALRALAVELESVFAADRRGADAASVGAHAMVETVDRVLDALAYAGDRTVD
jgi:hypothetical protein